MGWDGMNGMIPKTAESPGGGVGAVRACRIGVWCLGD